MVNVLKELRTGKEKKFNIESFAKKQGWNIHKERVGKEESSAWYISDNDNDEIQIQNIIHFVSKKGMNIVGFGKEYVRTLYQKNIIRNFVDIFEISVEDLQPLEGFKEKSISNLLSSIQHARTVSLARFLFALGIRHVGEETAILLANHFVTLQNISTARFEQLEEIDGIGEVVAQSIVEYFDTTDLSPLLEYINFSEAHTDGAGNVFVGKSVVVTGVLENFSRDEVKDMIRTLGGKISSSVSKNTDFVLVGSDAGSKLARAKELGVAVISEDEFMQMVKK